MKFHSGTFLCARMLFSSHLSDPLLLTQNRKCVTIELQCPCIDESIHPPFKKMFSAL